MRKFRKMTLKRGIAEFFRLKCGIFNYFFFDDFFFDFFYIRIFFNLITCYICNKLGLEHCISCFTCKYWYPNECVKPSKYILTNPESKWYCSKAKVEPIL